MKKRLLISLAIIWICISFLVISSTFAKYISSIGSNTNVSFATWKLSINNQDVISNNNFSSVLALTFPGGDYYIPNYIVPTAIGYCDLQIDSSELVMPYKYTITCALSNQNQIADVKLYGYSLNRK